MLLGRATVISGQYRQRFSTQGEKVSFDIFVFDRTARRDDVFNETLISSNTACSFVDVDAVPVE